MGRLQDFLLHEYEYERVEKEVAMAPFPFPFVVQSITEGEHKEIRKSCQTVSFDKKTHQRQTDTNTDQYSNRLVVACCVEPNFKDSALQEKYGVRGAEALIDKLLDPGQFTNLLTAIQEVNHFDNDINDLKEEAKN